MANPVAPSTSVIDGQNSKQKFKKMPSYNFIEYMRLIVRDGTYGYVFWSIFQGLAPMIWFYPLNELEISGYEAFAVVWLSPVFCLIPGVLPTLQNKWVLTLLRLLTVCSLVSYQANTTFLRLAVLGGGAGISMLVLVATLWHPAKAVRYRTFWGLIVGYHAYLASRVWFTSFVPAWWDQYSNSIVLAAGLVSSLGYILEETPVVESPPTAEKSDGQCSWVTSGLGLGSLLYLTHWCFGEASLLARWTVKGYPNHGPEPLPWGSLVLLALLLGSLFRRRQSTPVFNAIAAAFCFYFLYFYQDPYLAFGAGCCLAYLTMALWPAVVDTATQSHPALTLTLASFVYIIQVLFWVWTVAYNFVPYGEYTREHTDWLIGAVSLGILFTTLMRPSSEESHTALYSTHTDSRVPSFGHYVKVLLLVFLAGQCGMLKRHLDYRPGHPSHKLDKVNAEPNVFSAAIWTFHFGYDNRGWPSMERAATLLNDTGADVITLLESDASKPFLGNNDLAGWLAEKLQMYVDFGPATKDHTWGNLILSKYPIVQSVHHLLPSPHGELAPAVTASINISGTVVDFVVTHMGNDRDTLDRKLQAQFLAEQLRTSRHPAIFLGYVTSSPGSPNYQHLIQKGEVKDIDPTDHDRWCEYIMYKRLIRLGYARISHGGLSDTEVQVGTFRIPEDPQNYMDNEKVTTSPDSQNIDKDIRYNHKFGKHHRGHGYFKNHGFHMNTPKYFYN
ncbi:PGAP2-interacting protein [Aplysia californica]|uniref:PGAP2-interacting protein n=1 Tax=Aplysia californica TaxID=6500 RepID=A0ABM0K6A9_APLCA|nr:PGAP2-interacting protein [Aplysia californica]